MRYVSRFELRLGKKGLDSGETYPMTGGKTGYGQDYAGGRGGADGADPDVVRAFRAGFGPHDY